MYVNETLCPNRCEPSLEVIVKMGVRPGGGDGVCSKVGCRGLCGVNAKKRGQGPVKGSGWMRTKN